MKSGTQVVLLGTGTPNPVPDRSGPCVAIVVGDRSYIVDFGSGIVRQAEKAYRKGIKGLKPSQLKHAFLTHLHSDHTIGYPDLIYTPWVLERDEPLHVFGPKGLTSMTNHILQAYEVDVDGRQHGHEKANILGVGVVSKEIKEGLIYEDEWVKVEAFLVNHPPFESYGYKFVTEDRCIVVSGDTTPSDNLIKHAKGCDVLVHEVYASQGLKDRDAKWQKYHSSVHTSSIELGKIASEINPKILVLYHQLFMVGQDEGGEEMAIHARVKEMIDEIKVNYDGEVFSGNDLDVF